MKGREEPATVIIAGGGIVGLVLALALKKHVGIIAEVYEKASGFEDDVGAALGMYPNGLRVIRDIDPDLLTAIRDQGYPYIYRRWEKHDGTVIAQAKEEALITDVLGNCDNDLASIGIRRWRLQNILYKAVHDAGIPIYFKKAIIDVVEHDNGGDGDDRFSHGHTGTGGEVVEVIFEDGTRRRTNILFGADGGKSTVRQTVADEAVQLQYTGVTCLMGISDSPSPRRGISFPSSTSSKFHAVYFPTGKNEQCFQIHFPIDESDADRSNWGNLSKAEGREEFEKLANKLRDDGWADWYIKPLLRVEHAVKVGFALLQPPLRHWVYGKSHRIVLVGDAAHPPVPYIGQGAQMGVEDVGTVTLLMQHLCLDQCGQLDLTTFGKAMKIYEHLRIPRTSKILDCSKSLGDMQEIRSGNSSHHRRNGDDDGGGGGGDLCDLLIQGEVMMNDTLPIMFSGASYDYREDALYAIKEEYHRQQDKRIFDELMLKGTDLIGEAETVMGYY